MKRLINIQPLFDLKEAQKKLGRISCPRNMYLKTFNDRFFGIDTDQFLVYELTQAAFNYYNKENISTLKMQEILSEINNLEGAFKNVNNSLRDETKYINNLTLLITQTCNLKCKYCFAVEGTYSEKEDFFMTFEVAKQAIDKYFFHNKDNNGIIKIQFFGGEPLLNPTLIESILTYSESKRKRYQFEVMYTLITNGTISIESIKYILKRYNVNVRVSIDGDKITNDSNRQFKGKDSSVFESILENLKQEDRMDIEVVLTYTGSTSLLLDIESLISLGFKRISINPLVLYSEIQPLFCSAEELFHRLESQLPELTEYIANKSMEGEIVHLDYLDEYIKQIYKPHQINGCAAASQSIVVNTKGELYPCDYYLNNPTYRLGNVFDNNIQSINFLDLYNLDDVSIYNDSDCLSCYLRKGCKGKCPYKRNTPNVIGLCNYAKRKFEMSLYFISIVTEPFNHPNNSQYT